MKRVLIHLIALILLIVAFAMPRPADYGAERENRLATSRLADPISDDRTERDSGFATDPIADYRAERDKTRAQATAGYAALANDPDASVRDAAARALLQLSREIAAEGALEYALHMRGFRTATVSVTSSSATVFLRSAALTDAERAILLETVLDHTDLPASAVRIVPLR